MLSSILYISEKIRSQGNKGFYPEILHIGLVGLNHLFCGTPYQCGLALISHCYSLMLDLAQGPLCGKSPSPPPSSRWATFFTARFGERGPWAKIHTSFLSLDTLLWDSASYEGFSLVVGTLWNPCTWLILGSYHGVVASLYLLVNEGVRVDVFSVSGVLLRAF